MQSGVATSALREQSTVHSRPKPFIHFSIPSDRLHVLRQAQRHTEGVDSGRVFERVM